jgi:hypothetical protein
VADAAGAVAGAAGAGAGPVGPVGAVGAVGEVGAVAAVDDPLTAGLEPVAVLDGTAATATLEAPPTGDITVPFFVGLALAVCVAFTIFAGVSSPVIDFARQATTLF